MRYEYQYLPVDEFIEGCETAPLDNLYACSLPKSIFQRR